MKKKNVYRTGEKSGIKHGKSDLVFDVLHSNSTHSYILTSLFYIAAK